jgi:transcriptional regulator with XRE-family HTH domain
VSNTFGEMVRRRRTEMRLTLRECAYGARMDAGNLSRIERGRMAPPVYPDVLARLVESLELTGTPEAQKLTDAAALQNGRIPYDVISDDEAMRAMPLFIGALREGGAEALLELIRRS